MNEKCCILIQISLKFVPSGPIDNTSVLVQIIDWRRNRRRAIIWNHADLVHWRIYAALEGNALTHWGRMTHICVGKLIIIVSDNGLSPDRRQAIIWTNAVLLSIGPLLTYFRENLIKIQQFSLKKMHVKMSSAKWRPSCHGLNVLNTGIC